MAQFWADHLDFVFLVYGLAFLLLGLIVRSISRVRDETLSWGWLALFGFIHGLNEWADMVTLAYGENLPLQGVRCLLLVASFTALLAFGRRNVTWSGGKKLGSWIYLVIVPLLLLGATRGLAGVMAMARYCLAYPGALLAAVALWQWGVSGASPRAPVRRYVLAGAMALYAVAAGLISAKAPLWPASVFNHDWFMATTGFPIQLVRCLLACAMTLALWREHVVWREVRFSTPGMQQMLWVEKMGVGLIFVLLIGGGVLTDKVAGRCQDAQRENLLGQGRMIAMSINPDRVPDLDQGDHESHRRKRLSAQFQRIADASPEIRYVYLTCLRGSEVLFLLDVEPKQFWDVPDTPNAVPGDVYRDAPPELMDVFTNGLPRVAKPYRDKWGQFVSVFYPVTDNSAAGAGVVLGVDVDASALRAEVLLQRMAPLLITALLILLILMFVSTWRKTVEVGEVRTLGVQRVQRQQALLFELANSIATREGERSVSLDEILRLAGGVLGVEQALAWDLDKSRGVFIPASSRHPGGGAASTERELPLRECAELYLLLQSDRAIPLDDTASDVRVAGLASWFGQCGMRSVILAPYRTDDRIAGMIAFSMSQGRRTWMSDEVRFTAEVSDQISQLLANTRRRQAEQALRQMNNDLEQRVKERTAELSRKNDELLREMEERSRVEIERRQLEIQIQQAQKFESLGLMAGGIAHDFNNILMAIQGNVELARIEAPAELRIQEYLRDVDRAAARAVALARQMLAFSGRGHAIVQGVDLNTQVREMLQILEVSVGKKNTICCDFTTPLPPVDGDPSQISQVIMNLVVNAAESFGEKSGTVLVRTGTVMCDAGLFASMWLKDVQPEGRYVYIEVLDSGCGMDAVTQSRMFDPFFTTKFTGRGLGLATVMGIVRGHRGAIDVCSEVGRGTTIRVLFPLGQRVPELSAPVSKSDLPKPGEGTILVVDDEEPVRILGCRMIDRLGYGVLTAANGTEAVSLYREHQAVIRCVLLDLTMPGMDGREVFEVLRNTDPSVKVVICSGFNEEDVVARFGEWKLAGFLQKPYTLELLASCLNAVLN